MAIETTLTKFIMEEQRDHPGSSGNFTGLFANLATAGKIISREVNRAGLIDILGPTGDTNVQGEEVQKLDDYSNTVLKEVLGEGGHVVAIASEEEEDMVLMDVDDPKGKYIVLFDPLDGSSNIDVNISVGTIFSIYRHPTNERPTLKDLLKAGRDQVASGYILYGSSTIFVYTTGNGVHGFTLDNSIGEFLLSHRDIKIPEEGSLFSINEGNACNWSPWTGKFVELQKKAERRGRYVGSFVSDFHRNLLKGGIFLYPEDEKNPKGKLRLLYEANPMAMLIEAAGGAATSGSSRILSITPTELHERVPLIIGSLKNVEEAMACIEGE